MSRQILLRWIQPIFIVVLLNTALACTPNMAARSTATSAAATITYLETQLTPANAAPVVVLTLMGGSGPIKSGQKVDLQFEALDKQGIVKTELLVNGQLVQTDNFTPQPGAVFVSKMVWTPVAAGTFTLQIRVYNSANVVGQSNQVSIRVEAEVVDPKTPTPIPLSLLTPSPTSTKMPLIDTIRVSTATPTPTATEPAATPTPIPEISTSTFTPEPVPTPEQTNIEFRADRAQIQAGECVTIYWNVSNVKEVYYRNQGVAGDNQSRVECPTLTEIYELRVVRLDGGIEPRTIRIEVIGSGYKTSEIDLGKGIDFDEDGKVSAEGDDFKWVKEGDDRVFRKWDDDDDLQLVPVGPATLDMITENDCRWALDNLNDDGSITPFDGLAACFRTDEGRIGKLRFEDADDDADIEWALWD